jgi:putative membrane protein
MALAGVAIILIGWLAVSLAASVVESYRASPALGMLAVCVYGFGTFLIAAAAAREWRALLSLRRVDTLRDAMSDPARGSADFKSNTIAWLDLLSDRLQPAASIIAPVRGAESNERIAALVRDNLAAPLRDEVARIARRSAVAGGMLVALSPHAAWDGMIIAVWSLKIIRRVADVHGLRPGPLVTLLLFRRIARTAIEIAAVDLVAQNVAAKLLEHAPLLRHVASAIPGMGAAELRLYRFAILAGRACSPLEDYATEAK